MRSTGFLFSRQASAAARPASPARCRLPARLGLILIRGALRTERGYSLHVCVDVHHASGDIHGTRAPDLSRVDPRVVLGRRAETDVLGQVGDRLRSTRPTHAVGRTHDSATVVRLKDRSNVEIAAAVGAKPEIVAAPHSPRQPACRAALKRAVDANPLRWDSFLTRPTSRSGHAGVRHSRDLESVLVDLLAPQ